MKLRDNVDRAVRETQQLRAAAQKGGPVGWLMAWWLKRVLAK